MLAVARSAACLVPNLCYPAVLVVLMSCHELAAGLLVACVVVNVHSLSACIAIGSNRFALSVVFFLVGHAIAATGSE